MQRPDHQRHSSPSDPVAGLARMTRRTLLTAGTAGMLGVSLAGLSRTRRATAAEGAPASHGGTALHAPPVRPGKAKSVIFLYQFGGPSHIDTFDPKPDAPDGIRGEFGTIPTSLPGVRFGEHTPKLAKWAHRMAIVRSMHHDMKNHNPATYYNLTGRRPPLDDIRLRDTPELFPAYGSVVSRFRPAPEGIPGFVALPHVIRDGVPSPGQHGSFLGRTNDPFLITNDPNLPSFQLPELALPADTPLTRLEERKRLLGVVDRSAGMLEWSGAAKGLEDYHRRALAMLRSPVVRNAFDLTKEPAKLRDAYGRNTYGQSCLLARRLVEAGVTFVNVYFSSNIGNATSGGWDTHGENFKGLKNRLLPATELTVPTFLADLDARGLLDTTMVVWMGEFGRSPKVANTERFGMNGRDHWPQCYSMWMAGAGVVAGSVYGASDKIGGYPAKDPVTPDNIAATIYEVLGIPHETEMADLFARPLPIAAKGPIRAIMS